MYHPTKCDLACVSESWCSGWSSSLVPFYLQCPKCCGLQRPSHGKEWKLCGGFVLKKSFQQTHHQKFEGVWLSAFCSPIVSSLNDWWILTYSPRSSTLSCRIMVDLLGESQQTCDALISGLVFSTVDRLTAFFLFKNHTTINMYVIWF